MAEKIVKDSQGLAKELVNDTISRRAAVDMILGQPIELHYPSWYAEQIKALPSAQPKSYREGYQAGFKDAQPERKRGRWKVTPVYIKCSECGESFMLIPQNYCPHCGAKMEGEQDG